MKRKKKKKEGSSHRRINQGRHLDNCVIYGVVQLRRERYVLRFFELNLVAIWYKDVDRWCKYGRF